MRQVAMGNLVFTTDDARNFTICELVELYRQINPESVRTPFLICMHRLREREENPIPFHLATEIGSFL